MKVSLKKVLSHIYISGLLKTLTDDDINEGLVPSSSQEEYECLQRELVNNDEILSRRQRQRLRASGMLSVPFSE